MRLKLLQLMLFWPDDVPLQHLRPWLINQLKKHGEPLRWSITRINSSSEGSTPIRQLKVEAVVIISNSIGIRK